MSKKWNMAHRFKPESLMMSFGYDPKSSEGAVKTPIFQTSSFVFNSAEEGKSFFEVAYGKRERRPHEELGYIYSRLNNPDLEILEKRLCLWDGAEESAVFESGMSAITTTLLEFLHPGDLLLYSTPLYGGTEHFIEEFLPKFCIQVMGFRPGQTFPDLVEMIRGSGLQDRLKLIFLETPANPTNELVDIKMIRRLADHFSIQGRKVLVAVDNTYMGPLWQQPIKWGADLVIYSATKYIGGHSDVIAGAVLGDHVLISQIKELRTFLGNMPAPWTAWLLMRSLETLKVRMEQQQTNAVEVSRFLVSHPMVRKVNYLGHIYRDSPEYEIFTNQYTGTGAMLSFEIKGEEEEAFLFLNSLKLIKLAVSLGSTESLAEHPRTMTHAGLRDEQLDAFGISDALIRISVGLENFRDIIWDIEQALEKVAEFQEHLEIIHD